MKNDLLPRIFATFGLGLDAMAIILVMWNTIKCIGIKMISKLVSTWYRIPFVWSRVDNMLQMNEILNNNIYRKIRLNDLTSLGAKQIFSMNTYDAGQENIAQAKRNELALVMFVCGFGMQIPVLWV